MLESVDYKEFKDLSYEEIDMVKKMCISHVEYMFSYHLADLNVKLDINNISGEKTLILTNRGVD